MKTKETSGVLHVSPVIRIVSWPNLIGLDSPIVAICWQAMFAKIAGAELPWFIHVILGLSTWCIYLADRIVDVMRSREPLLTLRHSFTRRHLRKLIGLLVVVSICDLVLIVRFLPHEILFSGIITLGLIAIYYLIRLTRLGETVTLIPREVMCGMLFAVGCGIAPHAYSAKPWIESPTLFIPVIMFGGICSLSCILISIWENEADVMSDDPSITSTHSYLIPHISTILTSLIAISLILSCFVHWQALLSVSLSGILLRLALHQQNRISTQNLRNLADAVLIAPLVFVWF